jgi:hypothetical protein
MNDTESHCSSSYRRPLRKQRLVRTDERKAFEVTPELKAHRTTRDPASSVGRCKQNMDTETQRLFHSVFGDVLAEFGCK